MGLSNFKRKLILPWFSPYIPLIQNDFFFKSLSIDIPTVLLSKPQMSIFPYQIT